MEAFSSSHNLTPKQVEQVYSRFLLSQGVSIDTRTVQEGNLFFALKGPNFNGNQYAVEALDKGAAFAIVDEESVFTQSEKMVLVPNVLRALQQTAQFHRSRFHRPVIALTGSNGKTTTKELLAAVLGKKFQVLATKGNLNNHIGVPLTLFQIYPQIELAIIEMGASKPNDIAELCEIAQPTHGLITNIGTAHWEPMGGEEGIYKTKTELFDFLMRNNGFIFLNAADEKLKHYPFRKGIRYGEKPLSVHASYPFLQIKLESEILKTQITGDINRINIEAALAVGTYFEVSIQEQMQAISEYSPTNMRSQLQQTAHNQIIIDCYNANPDSMQASIVHFLGFPSEEKWLIIGDMLELGDYAKEAHQKIGIMLKESKVEQIIFVGKNMKLAYQSAQKGMYFENVQDVKIYLTQQQPIGKTILLKASRGIGLEKLLEVL